MEGIGMTDLQAFIKAIPKAELHVHFIGSIEPELAFELSQKNNIPLRFSTIEELRSAYQFTDLQSFIDLCLECSNVIVKESDFFDVTMSYLTRAHQDHVVHTEFSFEPQVHLIKGVPADVLMNGIIKGLQEGERQFGISTRLIINILRDFSEQDAFDTLAVLMPFREHIHAFGLSSSEMGHPPSKFSSFFAACRDLGFRVVVHAGEEGPPSYIIEALDIIKADRIDHGVRSIEDAALVERLATEQIPLTICPLSNVYLRVFPTMKAHSIKKLFDAGICVTINCDDPAYFGGYVNNNFFAVQEAFDLGKEQIVEIVKNGFKAAFITEEERQVFYQKVECYCKMNAS
jgi:adenosine deaminase